MTIPSENNWNTTHTQPHKSKRHDFHLGSNSGTMTGIPVLSTQTTEPQVPNAIQFHIIILGHVLNKNPFDEKYEITVPSYVMLDHQCHPYIVQSGTI